jgi:guanylate kinase
MNLKKQELDAVFIFIKPPSLLALKQRLISRNSDSQESIEMRLSQAQYEMSFEKEYDYQIINDNLSSAFEVLRAIMIAEEHKIKE